MGTRGLSSGDLTRLKRLRGAREFKVNVLQGGNRDVNPPPFPQLGYFPNFHSPKHMGSSRIRRTASAFTDLKGYSLAEEITQSQSTYLDPITGLVTNTNGKVLVANRICDCDKRTNPKKEGLCPSCSYSRT